MKKILGIVFLGLFLSGNASFAAEPLWNKKSLNTNINDHGWEVKNSVITAAAATVPVEIYTLIKGTWILKCVIIFKDSNQIGYCSLP
jgi:hypothetical protein